MNGPSRTTLVALLAFALALSGLLALPMRSYAAGTVAYVDAGANGANNGSSWADAFPSLADALAGAAADTEIWVAAGTYKPTSGTDRTATFLLKDGVAIYGGFAGGETQRDQRDWQTNVTTLSGDLNGDDSGAVSLSNPTRADNSYSVVIGATGAILDGFTVTGGHANDIFSAGLPSSSGGGMYNNQSSPTLTHVTFSGNTSTSFGGGMYNNAGSPVLTDVTFDGNFNSGNGGGLYSTGVANLTLTDVTFTGNVATYRGGGLHAEPGPTGLTTLTLTNVTFTGNSADFGGGLITFPGITATLTNVIFSGNSANYGGGLITTGSNNLTLTNVTISGNAALVLGGGLYSENGSNPQVRNSIVWGNGSNGVYIGNDQNKPASVPVFSASIVQGAGGSAAWNPTFATNTGLSWNTSYAIDGGGNLDADPLFVGSGDLHLSPGSPTINTGVNSFLPAGLTTDLDGNARIDGGIVDMGAYEVQDTTPPDTTPPDTAITSMPANPTSSSDAAFSFSGTDEVTPADELAFECALDGASFAGCTSSTSYSNLAPGSHTFEVRASDGAGNVDPTPASYSWMIVSEAPTTLLYNGAQIINVGSSFTPAALLSSNAAACVANQVVSFALDANPLTGADDAYALGTATTDSSGQATAPAVNTAGWTEGVYTINASFAGTSGCLPSSDSATLTVASPGAAANGGGWYTLNGIGRVNFGFTVRQVDSKCKSNCAYKGQLLLINNGKWRVKGNLASYSKTSTGQGAASGTGDLYWWDASLNGGLGDWALAQSGVSYTINFYDSGKSGKSSADTFGIRIVYTPVAPQPSVLPTSTPQLLKGGDIKEFYT